MNTIVQEEKSQEHRRNEMDNQQAIGILNR